MYPYEFTVSFRVSHPSQDLSPIYAMLGAIPGFAPGRIWKAGEERKTPKGEKLKGCYPNSYCYLNIQSKTQSVDESLSSAVEGAMDQIWPYKSALQEVVKTGGELSFFIGWFIGSNSGDTFDYQLLRQLAAMNISLEFDIYSEKASPEK